MKVDQAAVLARDMQLNASLDCLLEHPRGPGSSATQEDHELKDKDVKHAYDSALSSTCTVQKALTSRREEEAESYGDIGAFHGSPPKRKAANTTAAATTTETTTPKEKQSKLAKEHNISAREEREIREAFGLFAEPAEGEKEGVIPTKDVRRAMVALGLPPKNKSELAEFLEILDPDDEGYASYEPFVAICALKLHAAARERGGGGGPAAEEVDEAFRLFIGAGIGAGGGGGGGGEEEQVLTLSHLRRVAMTLKQDVDDQLLKDMILEANGGAGVGKGVGRAEFEEVMRRAGAWK
ncbi:uncharacterized protein F4812DRAFT_458881 [Daldinia caldariorum]|uniref:uncharacterized protein n=1 Tax=Daldinia caldariorum TaxID=326644 RepID=UPI0020084C14|nr:uncharacterized protein F4812DRAFT_458881 [Daldinia caldariorum]KAI1468447.1 hypothetical protein F4812DRAFT_458881 [Daldinia caldariorum]